MEIHIAREGRQLGPFSRLEVQRMLNAGEVSPNDLAWTPGSANWVPLNTIPGIGLPDEPEPPAVPAVPPAAALPAYPQRVPMGAPAAGVLRPALPTSGFSVASLVLGIVGLTMMPIIASIPAVIFGHMARAEIKKSEGNLGGDGMAVAGLITGYISLILWSLLIVVMVVMLIAGVAMFPKLMNELSKPTIDSPAVASARIVSVACSSYASQHDGLYPKKLEDLVPDYLADHDIESSELAGEKAYEYLGGRDTDPPYNVLFYSKEPLPDGRRIIGRMNGVVTTDHLPPELKQRAAH